MLKVQSKNYHNYSLMTPRNDTLPLHVRNTKMAGAAMEKP